MSNILKRARETLEIEIAGIELLKERLNLEFEEAVRLLFSFENIFRFVFLILNDYLIYHQYD